MKIDPISGPLDRNTLKELVAAPFGVATETIRKFDPLWGRAEGEKFRWKVTGKQRCAVYAYIMAASQEEADELADDLDDGEFDTEGWGGIEIISVEPDRQK